MLMATSSRSSKKAANLPPASTSGAEKSAKKLKKAADAQVAAPPPIRILSVVGIYVRDYDEALDFYVNKLGFVKRTDFEMGPEQRWVTVAPPDQKEVEIVLLKPNAAWHGAENVEPMLQRVGQSVTWSYGTDDCQAAYETLTARGVTFRSPPTKQMYGIEAVLEDLYGNSISLLQRSDWAQSAS